MHLAGMVDKLEKPDVILELGSGNIRYRHVVKGGRHFHILFNEESEPVSTTVNLAVEGKRQWSDPKLHRPPAYPQIWRSSERY